MKSSQRNFIQSYEGWLTKQGLVFKTWKRRWFVLKGSVITYYVSPSGKIKGTISLKDSTVQLDKESKRQPAFKITTPDRIYNIVADTQDDANAWVNAIMIANGQKISTIGLDDFEILKVLGRGTLGKVQLVRFKKNNQLYALKSMSKAKLEEAHLVSQTLNEKNALLAIHHPFIVSAKYTFQTETQVFIALDYVPGGELLKQLEIEGEKNDYQSYSDEEEDGEEESEISNETCNDVKKNTETTDIDISNCNSISMYDDQNYGGFVLHRARLYAAQLALAIQYLHSTGYIHRDLKPSNILIDRDGYIKLTDFGFVKEKMFDIFQKTSTFCGTPMYAAPEIVTRKPYGRSVDWWSFGIIVYEMIFYKTPFFSNNLDSLFKQITTQKLTFPQYFTIEGQVNSNDIKKEIPLVLVNFLSKLLEKDPRNRLGTYDEEDIFNHPFFEGIKWNDLLNKSIAMEWKPNLKKDDDVSCFYDDFTKEIPSISVIDPLYVTNETNEAFTNFTYVDTDGVLH